MMDKFFKTLFQYIDGQYILLWLYDGDKRKESYWFTDHTVACSFVETMKSKKFNIYCGVGLSPKDYGRDNRCLKKDIVGIPALWLDIDIQGPNHKKQNLPASLDEAMKLFNAIEQQPTMVIHSGGGIQAWWVFQEPWIFESDADRQCAENLSKRFIYRFKEYAKAFGWDVDSVFNLDRVLRVPGTYNRKGEPVPVNLLECNDLRYNPSDFDASLPELDQKTKTVSAICTDDLVLDPNAQINIDKHEALIDIEPKYKLSWERKRKDLQDQSASSYDLSLANFAAMAQWTDQEIANLLIAWRRKHGEDLKLRQDYYKRTIAIARNNAKRYHADLEIAQTTMLPPELQQDLTPERKQALLDSLSTRFNVNIIKIVKYLSDPPTYYLETSSGSISLGDVDNLIVQSKLRNKLAAATGRYLPRFSPDTWDGIAQALLNVCSPEEVGQEATEVGQINEWLTQYLNEKTVFSDATAAVVNSDPFKEDGVVFIFGSDFRRWIRITQMEKLSAKQMGTLLKKSGAQPIGAKNIMIDGKWTTRSVWRLMK